jgi:hypothetical protein
MSKFEYEKCERHGGNERAGCWGRLSGRAGMTSELTGMVKQEAACTLGRAVAEPLCRNHKSKTLQGRRVSRHKDMHSSLSLSSAHCDPLH